MIDLGSSWTCTRTYESRLPNMKVQTAVENIHFARWKQICSYLFRNQISRSLHVAIQVNTDCLDSTNYHTQFETTVWRLKRSKLSLRRHGRVSGLHVNSHRSEMSINLASLFVNATISTQPLLIKCGRENMSYISNSRTARAGGTTNAHCNQPRMINNHKEVPSRTPSSVSASAGRFYKP